MSHPAAARTFVLGASLVLGGLLCPPQVADAASGPPQCKGAGNTNIPGTNAPNTIRMGKNMTTGHYWYQLDTAGPFDGGTTLTCFTVDGKQGNDVIDATGIAVVAPFPIDIVLYASGGSGNDTIRGGTANDRLFGNGGGDTILGGDGNDDIDGGDGGDSLYGNNGRDTISGRAGGDSIYGGAGIDTLFGGDSADTIYGDADTDYIYGEAGGDTLIGNDGADYLLGGARKDYVYGSSGNDWIFGGAGNDYLAGESGADRIFGDAGGDVIFGGSGDDPQLRGGDGDDKMYGGSGRDDLDGESGKDHVYGQRDLDVVRGGPGKKDVCVGAADTNGETIDGGTGSNDKCSECAPDACAAACETQTGIPYGEVAAQDPVTVIFNPDQGQCSPGAPTPCHSDADCQPPAICLNIADRLTFIGDAIDLYSDSEDWSQFAADESPCFDPIMAIQLTLGGTAISGSNPDNFFFDDVPVTLGAVLTGTLLNVTLERATGLFSGELDVVTIDTSSSRLLKLLDVSPATIECTIMDPDAAAELLVNTNDFVSPGQATGAFTCSFAVDYPTAAVTLENCTNGIDDNANGCIDCDDKDCAQNGNCFEGNCTDAQDSDGDTLFDCDDPDCSDDPTCSEQGSNCSDTLDNDADGSADCLDQDCFFNSACTENCTNSTDDNGNALIDCADPFCSGEDLCLETLHCNDGLDNDGNGSTDCNDSACAFDDACATPQACCFGNTCQDLPPHACEDAGGDPQGLLTNCADLDDPPCIPTLSQWGVVVMALLVLAAGSVVVRARQLRPSV